MTGLDDTSTVVIEREFPHSPEKVWRALTQAELLSEWLMNSDFQPAMGHVFTFRADPMPHWNGVIDCEVLEVVPYKRISYTWNASGAEAADGLKTIVTWTLTPTPRGALVRMEQSGFRPEDRRNYQGAQYGWRRYFDGLQRVIEGLGE